MKPYTVRLFKEDSAAHDWRWDLAAPNGKLVATCGEGYRNRMHAMKMVQLLFPWIDVMTPQDPHTVGPERYRGLPPERKR